MNINLRFLDIAYKERFGNEVSWMMKFTNKIKREKRKDEELYKLRVI
jgi:hypothetical protein